jgi:hypothetical protein
VAQEDGKVAEEGKVAHADGKVAQDAVVAEVAEERALAVGDWVVLTEGATPWFGVISDMMKDEQLVVHQFRFRESKRGPPGRCYPVWINDAGRTRCQQFMPLKFNPAAYNVSQDNVILSLPRVEKDFFLPVVAMKAIADYSREH